LYSAGQKIELMAVLKDSNKTVEMMGLIAVELKEARKVGKKDYLMVV